MIRILFFVWFAAAATAGVTQHKPEVAFTLKEKDLVPEGIAHDPVTKSFFVGSIYKRKVVRITEHGVVSDFIRSGQDEILEVLGMKVDARNRTLWVCNNSPEQDTVNLVANIHVYDLTTGKLVKRYTLQDNTRHLFNDVYITDDGETYVTDSNAGAVHVIRKGSDTVEEFVKSRTFAYPNGITATGDEKAIIVATASARGLVMINRETKELKDLKSDKRFLIIGIDGLYRYNNTLIGIQNVFFPEAIHRYHLPGNDEKIERFELLAAAHPEFETPTTGTIAGNYLYFIANSQLFHLIGNNGRIRDPEKLKEIKIMRIRLD